MSNPAPGLHPIASAVIAPVDGLFEGWHGRLYCTYRGPSMTPMFSPQDILELARPSGRRLRCGDVVVFRSPEQPTDMIVHRVSALGDGTIRTCGDHNSRVDPWSLPNSAVLGLVVAAWRGQQRRHVSGGLGGQVTAHVVRARLKLNRLVHQTAWSPLRSFYRAAASRRLISRWLPVWFTPQVFVVSYPQGPQAHLLLRRKAIGDFDGKQRVWRIRPPFRLLVDERRLVVPPLPLNPGGLDVALGVGRGPASANVAPLVQRWWPAGNPAAFSWLTAALATRWGGPAPQSDSGDSAAFWPQVTALVQEHQVAALLYRQVRRREVVVPRTIALWLAVAHEQETRRLTPLRAAVVEVLEGLAQAGVPFLVLKGWSLLPLLYEDDLAQRPAGDLDIYVPKPHHETALAVLQRLGCRPMAADAWPGFALRYDGSMKLRYDGAARQQLVVDLHWQFLPTPWYWQRLGCDWMPRVRTLDSGGWAVPALAPTDLLLYLCVHMGINHHAERNLLRHHDLALLIQQMRADLDWDALIDQARSAGVILPVCAVLTQLQSYWPGVTPERVMRRLAGLPVSRRERWLYSWQVEHTHDAWSGLVLKAATLPGLGRRLRYLLEMAFPSPAYLRRRYGLDGSSAWYSGYLHRLGIACRQVGGHLRQAIGKG